MPCYDGRDAEFNDECHQYVKGMQSFVAYQRHNSHLAQMLCSVCQMIDDVGQLDLTPKEVQDWWLEHVDRDIKLGKRTKNGKLKERGW